MIQREALKESFSDTVLGTLVNFPLNYILIAFSLSLNMTAVEMTFFLTAVMFILAVARKYYIRIYFQKKQDLAKQK